MPCVQQLLFRGTKSWVSVHDGMESERALGFNSRWVTACQLESPVRQGRTDRHLGEVGGENLLLKCLECARRCAREQPKPTTPDPPPTKRTMKNPPASSRLTEGFGLP